MHFGHLRPALDVHSLLSLSEIRFIPCGQPPHRDTPVASAEQRLTMLKLALEGQSDFVVDDREIQRGGASYMVDTLNSMVNEFGDEKFCLILGKDAFVNLPSWKDWTRITELVSMVITQRPQIETDSISNPVLAQYIDEKRLNDKKEFINSKETHCFFCPVTQLDISATSIREIVHAGHSIDFLVPEKVADYIQIENLYR